jgi:hypothetical protein
MSAAVSPWGRGFESGFLAKSEICGIFHCIPRKSCFLATPLVWTAGVSAYLWTPPWWNKWTRRDFSLSTGLSCQSRVHGRRGARNLWSNITRIIHNVRFQSFVNKQIWRTVQYSTFMFCFCGLFSRKKRYFTKENSATYFERFMCDFAKGYNNQIYVVSAIFLFF